MDLDNDFLKSEKNADKDFDLRIRAAERAHDDHGKHRDQAASQLLSFANAGMRAPGLVAAGGLAASLAFYSANYGELIKLPAALGTFNSILFWLFLSLLCTVVAPGFAYFSQLAYLHGYAKESRTWTHPYIESSKASRVWEVIGNIWRWLSVTAVIASISCLVYGGIIF